MVNDAILTTEDLRTVTGYQRVSDVERCLTGQGVRFFRGKDGPWTTLTLINAAGGVTPASSHEPMYEGTIL